MRVFLKTFFKYLSLFIIGGTIYYSMETLFRGYSHYSMIILGGICFISCGLLNEFLNWNTPLILQGILGSVIITLLEFLTGVLVNIVLKLDVWDYSNMPLNIMGQVCLPFSLLWVIIAICAIILDDYIRYCFFDEEKPRYKSF
jgi:uncharacterized membrane protein